MYADDSGRNFMALENINLEIGQGEFFVLAGPSGCGKSTLLRIMSGLEKDFQGTRAFGAGVSQSDIGFVFQQFALLPWLTVRQNVEMGLLSKDLSVSERNSRISLVLNELGIEKFSRSYPRELSGGLKQRTGLARALVIKPKIIFMDEPFSEVDSFTAETLRQLVLKMWQSEKPTIIMVTHLLPEAIQLADRIAVMTPSPGKIEKLVHNPIARPRNMRSPEFFTLEDDLVKLIKP